MLSDILDFKKSRLLMARRVQKVKVRNLGKFHSN